MSFYRVYVYPMRKKQFRHIYFSRNRCSLKEAEKNTAEILEKLSADQKRDENLCRARRTVRDIILCNKFDYFCTFTFNGEKVDRYNFKACKKKITDVFKNYKNRYAAEFRYIIIPEFHRDGAVHFHGLIRGLRDGDLTVPEYIWKRDPRSGQLLMVPNTRKYVDWTYYSKKLGYFSCSRIKHYGACAVYVSKYITKDLINLPLGQRVFMASEGLQRPDLAFDEDDVPLVFDPEFKNEFCAIADSDDSLGLVPEWYGECCSELRDPVELEGEVATREAALFSRMTGKQLAMKGV